jgi:hypothetical protein
MTERAHKFIRPAPAPTAAPEPEHHAPRIADIKAFRPLPPIEHTESPAVSRRYADKTVGRG